MLKIGLLLIGIAFTLIGSNNITKEVNVGGLINSGPGTYNVYGLYSSDIETGKTYISGSGESLTAWGCEYCNGYGKAKVEKRGSDITIKDFTPLVEFKNIANVIEVKKELDSALLEINNEVVHAAVEVERPSTKAYYINNKWIIK